MSHIERFNYTSRQPGSTSGLQVALFADKANYLHANSASTGFRVSNILYFQNGTDGRIVVVTVQHANSAAFVAGFTLPPPHEIADLLVKSKNSFYGRGRL